MAREIKFRARVKYPKEIRYFGNKDIAEREWIEGDLHLLTNVPHIHPSMGMKYPIDVETICEYTGVRDQYGTPIYEGDIVRFHIHDRFVGDPEYQDGTIVFDDGRFFARLKDSVHYLSVVNYDDYEVIGNKFDN